MKTSESRYVSWFKNNFITPLVALSLAMPSIVQAQNLVNSSTFFQPVFTAREVKAAQFLALGPFDQTTYTFSPPTSVGNVTWSHKLTGHHQVGTNIGVASADIQLRSFAQTTGNSLVFGREINTVTGGAVALLGDLNPLVNSLIGASLANTWSSTAEVTGLSLTAGQLYSVTFDVTRAAGLNLNALSYANFSILNNGVAIQNVESSTLLNVLNLINLGTGAQPAKFEFYAPAGLTSLDLVFTAATVADVTVLSGGLGSGGGNQNVMTISNVSLAPVPEVSSLALASIGMILLLRRRRPCQL